MCKNPSGFLIYVVANGSVLTHVLLSCSIVAFGVIIVLLFFDFLAAKAIQLLLLSAVGGLKEMRV